MSVWRQLVARLPSLTPITLAALIPLLSHPSPLLVAESIITIRLLFSPSLPDSITQLLLAAYETLVVDAAKVCVLWILARTKLGADALRVSIKTIGTQSSVVKHQILILAAVMAMSGEARKLRMADYVVDICAVDLDVDLRDQARMFAILFKSIATPEHRQILTAILTPAPQPSVAFTTQKFRVGTLSSYLGRTVSGYVDLPVQTMVTMGAEDRQKATKSWHRDRVVVGDVQAVKTKTKRVVTLDDFYDDVKEKEVVRMSAPPAKAVTKPLTIDSSSSEESESSEDSVSDSSCDSSL